MMNKNVMMRQGTVVLLFFILLSGCMVKQQEALPGKKQMTSEGSTELTPLELLGKKLFFDPNLSSPTGQSCLTCHNPAVGWTGPNPQINLLGAVYPGAVHTRFGNRRPPSAAYAGYSPPLHYDEQEGVYIGGMFWDGRATGKQLGDPLAEQAQGPFLNPVEQNLPDEESLCKTVRAADYANLFHQIYPSMKKPLDCAQDARAVYNNIARAIAAFERSAEVNPFSSKYDAYLKICISAGNSRDACAKGMGDKADLDPRNIFTSVEWNGLTLFIAENDNDGIREPGEGGLCAACHVVEWITSKKGSPVPPLFTDHTYDNIGGPRNTMNPFYAMPPDINPQGNAWIDLGLGGFLETTSGDRERARQQYGKMKVPTLRNVDKRPAPGFHKSFGHNGYFKSLEDIVHFYNARDMLPICSDASGIPGKDCWPEPEVPMNVNREELGKLALTEEEERALVAFMQTLSDGYDPGGR